MMYLKFILQQLKVVGMVIIGFFIFFPILYPKRKKIWEMRLWPAKERKWYWWYADSSETGFGNDLTDNYNYLNSTYGMYELVKKRGPNGFWIADYDKFNSYSAFRKMMVAFNWTVFRNGAWNYIASVFPPPIVGDDYNCIINESPEGEGPYACTLFRNQRYHGEQLLKYPKIKPTHFRYSVTKPAKWYNLHRLFAFIFSFKWYTHFNFMIGAASHRYLVKMRSFNPAETDPKGSRRQIKGNLIAGSKTVY